MDTAQQWNDWRDKIIGLGEESCRKNYYPELQKRLEELKASEADLLTLFDSVTDAILVHDLEGHVHEVNQEMLSMYRVTRQQATSFTIADYSAPGPQTERLSQLLSSLRQGQPKLLLEWQARRPVENTLFDAEVSLQATQWKNRTMVVAVVRDISARKLAEQKRRELEQQLAEAQKMESIGRLTGGVAHHFNNMLQAIIGNADLALEEVPRESPARDHLQEILTSAYRSAELTRQMLAFARKEAIQPRVLNLNDAIASMLKMLRQLIGENIRLDWVPDKALWPVLFDPSQLDQILVNLCANSRDAISDTGSVTLTTSNATLDSAALRSSPGCPPGDYVMLAVSDTGQGMDDLTLSHLFEPFFTTKALDKGTGLGLATVFGIVKQNNGFIGVTSQPGRGSEFRIYLPRTSTAPSVATPPATASARGTETILFVEDELQVLNLGRQILERRGYRVLASSSPEQACALAASHAGPIDMLVADVVMPVLNGKELLARLRITRPAIKCLFVSGYTSDVIESHGTIDEEVQFLQKPFSGLALTQKVRETLDRPILQPKTPVTR